MVHIDPELHRRHMAKFKPRAQPAREIPASLEDRGYKPMPGLFSYVIPGPAPGAVRQTQSDKWKKRPCVLAYREWCDLARKCCPNIAAAELISWLNIKAIYTPPESWTKAERARAIGQRKRTKPDGDNIIKALCDALWKNDAALGDQAVSRYWGAESLLEVTIFLG
jgi:hypothetical protein